jgi:carboxyl-terminal processing protease
MNSKLIRCIILIIIFIIIIFDNNLAQVKTKQDVINLQAQKLKYILEVAEKYHIDSIDIVNACDKAFESLLNQFDAQSYYYNKNFLVRINEKNQGTSIGIGADFTIINDTLIVLSISENSPADKAGMKIGDKVLFINNISAIKLDRSDALKKISGDSGTVVSLIVQKFNTDELKAVNIMRGQFESYSVNAYYMIANSSIGYISMNRFSELSLKEFETTATNLLKLGMKKIILDLRGNPGGYLGQAVSIADEFLKEGLTICETKSKNKEFEEKFKSSSGGLLESLPLVVIMDSNSASGSEVIAGAIQDNDRGLIVGGISYGKATAQKMFSMIDSTAFKLTVAEYLTPLGRKIQKVKSDFALREKLDPSTELNLDEKGLKNLEYAMQTFGGKTEIPVYKTPKGRSLISTGGIFPDFFIKNDTLTILTNVLKRKGIFIEWALNYLKINKNDFKNKYSEDFKKFLNDFVITDDIIKDFVQFSISKNVWNNDMYKIDSEYISNFLKSIIAYIEWGTAKYLQVLSQVDKNIQKAVEKLPEAEKLLN